jgi:hypothetical protein
MWPINYHINFHLLPTQASYVQLIFISPRERLVRLLAFCPPWLLRRACPVDADLRRTIQGDARAEHGGKGGRGLFGESVNLYNGKLEFAHTDVSLPGNDALPVAVGRRISAGENPMEGKAFGRWELDIPHISGLFPSSTGCDQTLLLFLILAMRVSKNYGLRSFR